MQTNTERPAGKILGWVKASERLPDPKISVASKWDGAGHGGGAKYLERDTLESMIRDSFYSNVVWLEEIEASAATEAIADWIRMKATEVIEEALQKFTPLSYTFWNTDRVQYVVTRMGQSIMAQLYPPETNPEIIP